MKEQLPDFSCISRRDFLRIGLNTALGLMSFESSLHVDGRKGFIDTIEEPPVLEGSADRFEQYVHGMISPFREPFKNSDENSLERRRTAWNWYAAGVLGQLLLMVDKLDEQIVD